MSQPGSVIEEKQDVFKFESEDEEPLKESKEIKKVTSNLSVKQSLNKSTESNKPLKEEVLSSHEQIIKSNESVIKSFESAPKSNKIKEEIVESDYGAFEDIGKQDLNESPAEVPLQPHPEIKSEKKLDEIIDDQYNFSLESPDLKVEKQEPPKEQEKEQEKEIKNKIQADEDYIEDEFDFE